MTSNRWTQLLCIVAIVAIAGCAALDSATQPGPNGGPSLVQKVAGGLGLWSPIAGTVLGALGSAYFAIRNRQHKAALGSVVEGIEAVKTHPSVAKIALDVLVGTLEAYQTNAGTRDTVRSVLAKVKGNGAPPPAPGT